MTSVTIGNGVKSIGSRAFRECPSLSSITIPDNVTTIGDDAFWYCTGLTSVTISNSVTTLGNGVFGGCSSLTSVTIPNSVTSIGERAFNLCSGLTSITIPNSVTSIEYQAFWGCASLTSVKIGYSVKSLGYEAFGMCKNLTDVICYAENVPSAKNSAFESPYIENATLHVPERSIDKYRSNNPWNRFGSIVPLTSEELALKFIDSDESQEVFRYTLDGKSIHSPQKGLNIIKTKNGQTRKIIVK